MNELYHYGIPGMKWGVRRYQNPDGTLTEKGKKRYGLTEQSTKKDVKRVMKISTADKNVNAVGRRYEIELLNDPNIKKHYSDLKKCKNKANEAYAKLYNKLNPELKKLDPKTFDFNEAFNKNLLGDKYGNYNEPFDSKFIEKKQSKESSDFWKSLESYNRAVNNIQKEQKRIGEKYVNQFNEARLKDFAYEGNLDTGKKLLNEYGGFKIRDDGRLTTNTILGNRSFYPDEFWKKYRYSDQLWDL